MSKPNNDESMAEAIRSVGGNILIGLLFMATALADGFAQILIGALGLLCFIAGISEDIKRKERRAKANSDIGLSPQ